MQLLSVSSEAYKPSVLQDSAQESVITRDIHRTFPAHDYFKESDGDGQDSLYKICKVSPITNNKGLDNHAFI